MNKDSNYVVYAVQCRTTKRMYIGTTNNLEERIYTHLTGLASGRYANTVKFPERYKQWYEEFQKYGRDDFDIFVLEDGLTYDNHFAAEMKWQIKYKTYDEKYGFNALTRKIRMAIMPYSWGNVKAGLPESAALGCSIDELYGKEG